MSGSPVTSDGISLEDRTKQHESEFPKDFRGPVADSKRSCTDFAWSILFGLFWVGMLAIGVVAMQEAAAIGGSTRVVNGYQSDGKICGQDGKFGAGVDYKYLYTYPSMEDFVKKMESNKGAIPWKEFTSLKFDKTLCVKACPTAMGMNVSGQLMNNNGANVAVSMPSWVKMTQSNYHSRCYPDAHAMLNASSTGQMSLEFAHETFVDLMDAGGAIGAAFGFSLLYSSLFLTLMYYFAGLTVLLAIIFGCVAFGVSGYFFYFLATCTNSEADKKIFSSCGSFEEGSTFITTFWIGAALCWGILVLFMMMVFCMRKRIYLAIKLVKQATVAIRDMKAMLLVPLVKMALVAVVIVWWMFVTTALGSAGTLEAGQNATFATNPHTCSLSEIADFKFCSAGDYTICCDMDSGPTKSVKWNDTMYGLFFYHFFGLLWTAAFILAAMNFTLSSATCEWYFAESENGELKLDSPIKTGLRRAYGKHGGTLAFGSFLVATLEAIRMIVDYMASKANKEAKESGNKAVQCIVGCISCIAMCCVRCVEACIKYITSEAYIFTALFGKGLCSSVHSTFAFLGANAARVVVLSGIGNAIVFIAKIFVVGMTGMSTYAVLIYTKPYSETVSNPWLPLVVACCVAYMVCRLFMAVFARTIDTLLVCFVADEHMQNKHGTPSRKPDFAQGINEHAPPKDEVKFV